MKWKLVIFDLDGTLINTIDDLGTAVNFALKAKCLPQHEIPEYRHMVGNGIRNLVMRAMPDHLKSDEALLDELLSIFVEYYTAHIDDRSVPYPGIPELLSDLRKEGTCIALASNKFQAGAEKLVGKVFPGVDFSVVLGGRPGVPLKPDPAVVETIMAEVGAVAAETVMVGDSGTDMATARNAGVTGVGVTWGFKQKEAAEGAAIVADTTADLRKALL